MNGEEKKKKKSSMSLLDNKSQNSIDSSLSQNKQVLFAMSMIGGPSMMNKNLNPFIKSGVDSNNSQKNLASDGKSKGSLTTRP